MNVVPDFWREGAGGIEGFFPQGDPDLVEDKVLAVVCLGKDLGWEKSQQLLDFSKKVKLENFGLEKNRTNGCFVVIIIIPVGRQCAQSMWQGLHSSTSWKESSCQFALVRQLQAATYLFHQSQVTRFPNHYTELNS